MSRASKSVAVPPRSSRAIDSHRLLMVLFLLSTSIVVIAGVVVAASLGYPSAALVIGLVGGGCLSTALC